MDDSIFLHCLNLFPKFGPKRLTLLANYFESFEAAFKAPIAELAATGIGADLAEGFATFRSNIEPDSEAEKLQSLNMSLLALGDARYPAMLAEISMPPALLYYRGALPDKDAVMLAAVGTRKITTYGRSVIPHIIGPLVDAGIVIVSGMAYGIDGAVHQEIVHKHKPTVAVFGSGIDDHTLYPKHHALLAQEVIDAGGCLLSEYPPGTPGFKQNFVARNRIISGMSLGTIIIECDLKSGSLITAQYALDQNRRVYAVPGPIYANESRGPNNLIKMGAQLITDSRDILQDLNIAAALLPIATPTADNPSEGLLLGLLGGEPITADELVKQSGLETRVVTTALTFLEMKGHVKNVGASQYVRTR